MYLRVNTKISSYSVQPERNTLYWHYSVPPLEEEGAECSTCSLSVIIKPSMMEIVETLNPGQPPLPDWVYNGAILGGSRHPSLLSPPLLRNSITQTAFIIKV